MITMRKFGQMGLALTLGPFLFSNAALAVKGGNKPPPQPPAGWEVVILEPDAWGDAYGASGTRQAGRTGLTGEEHAMLWSGTADSGLDLNPSWAARSTAYCISDGLQVGVVILTAAGPFHAALWSGTPESCVDLNPAGSTYSSANGVGDGQQVGSATVGDGQASHAGLWTGTAESWVDLHPLGVDGESVAYGTSGGQQVGAVAGYGASLWSGSPASWVALTPASSFSSCAYAISGGQQVGCAMFQVGWTRSKLTREKSPSYETHAGLWSGTAESWVDLNPSGSHESVAYGVCRGYQAGYAISDVWRAGIWNGTANSWVDLSAYLPADCIHSCARGIDVTDTDIWVVGWVTRPAFWGAITQPVLWHKRLSD